MSFKINNLDEFEEMYNREFSNNDRQIRRKRKVKAKHVPKKSQNEIVSELAETNATEGTGFKTTYQASRYEEGWLMSSLHVFYQQEFITDVLGVVKGGKEASVYRCAARPGMDAELLAAKVYRPRQFRQLRNDKMYREGRSILSPDGKIVKQNNQRAMRALDQKSAFGAELEHTSWLMYEFTTLQRLYKLGAAVPKPYSASENAILMGYVGGETIAAPPLSEVRLNRDEAVPLYKETMRNLELMLANGMIHGDLSGYNILYWEGKITLIDFPQVTDAHSNSQAYFILQRDIERVCEYFSRQGVKTNAKGTMHYLWKQYVEQDADQRAADLSRLAPEPDDE